MNVPVEPKTTAIAVARPKSVLLDNELFEQAQRAANALAVSPLFPEHLRKGGKDVAIANGVLVMNIAHRMSEDPLTVAQNIFFIGGRPGWNASYVISRANQAGIFRGRIGWNTAGEGEDLVVEAYATLADTGGVVSAKSSMAMARAEGWVKNPKYQSMPEQMLRYRSATLLVRLYCPEVMLGYQTTEEIEDVRAATAVDVTPAPDPALEEKPAPKVEPKKRATKKPPAKVEPVVVDGEAEPVDPVDDSSGPKASDPEGDEPPAHIADLMDRLRTEIPAQATLGDVEATLELFGVEIESLRASYADLADEIDELADETRERLSKEED